MTNTTHISCCYLSFYFPGAPLSFSTDVIFVVDASKEVSVPEFKQEKQIVNYLARLLNIKPKGSRGALITFADSPKTNIIFDSYRDLPDFQSQVGNSPYIGGTRRIDRAVRSAAELMKRARPDASKIVILLTNGRKAPGAEGLREATRPLRELNAKTFVVVVGSQPNLQRDLLGAVDQPDDLMKFVDFGAVLPKGPDISRHISSSESRINISQI